MVLCLNNEALASLWYTARLRSTTDNIPPPKTWKCLENGNLSHNKNKVSRPGWGSRSSVYSEDNFFLLAYSTFQWTKSPISVHLMSQANCSSSYAPCKQLILLWSKQYVLHLRAIHSSLYSRYEHNIDPSVWGSGFALGPVNNTPKPPSANCILCCSIVCHPSSPRFFLEGIPRPGPSTGVWCCQMHALVMRFINMLLPYDSSRVA